MTDLFTPLRIRGVEARNRIAVSPMCQYSCDRDGLAKDWHLVHLGSRAVGGAGTVVSEATAVSPEGRISPNDLGLWSADHADALRGVADFVSRQGAVPAVQLAHAGRKASTSRPWEGRDPLSLDEGGWETLAPSDVPYPYDGEAPPVRRMDSDDIEKVKDDFASAAERALDIGFEVAEVHAAHGYLLHEFLSPVTNGRDDEYGGCFRNRVRLVREVVREVRDVWDDDKPVFVRVSATDWLPDRDSWTVDDTVRLADLLHDDGADLIDVSSGGLHPDQSIPHTGANYQVPLAERVRNRTETEVLTSAVGCVVESNQADGIVRNNRADLVMVGREHLRNPYFALDAGRELGIDDLPVPSQYLRGF